MEFEKTCMLFSMREPYYGIVLSSMKRIPTEKIDTIGVTRMGNVFALLYNTKFVENLSIEETLTVLKHEMLHIAFNHFSLFDTVPTSQDEQILRNYATDMEVNSYIKISNIERLKPIIPDIFGWNKQQGTMWYYTELQKMLSKHSQKQPKDSTRDNNNGNSGQTDKDKQSSQPQFQTNSNTVFPLNNSSVFMDDHSIWPKDQTEAEIELTRQMTDELLVYAAEETTKNFGDIPSELTMLIETAKAKKRPKPVTDWRRYFRRYLGNEFSELIRKTKRRESRRFPDAIGNTHKRKSHILVGIDTSGSISMPEYNEFFEQIKTLSSCATFQIVECDSKIQYEYTFKKKQNDKVHGGGGTNFKPVIDLFLSQRKNYDALVYFTDGCAIIPKNTPKETLWVISSNGDKKKNYKINGASVVFIPSKTQK